MSSHQAQMSAIPCNSRLMLSVDLPTCLLQHLAAGTCPTGQGEAWTDAAFARKVPSCRTKTNYVSPRSTDQIEPILLVLFGSDRRQNSEAREALRQAFRAARLEKSAAAVRRTKADLAGSSWIVKDDHFVLSQSFRLTDSRAARDPIRQQMQAAIRTLAERLVDRATRLRNSPTWGDMAATASELARVTGVYTENPIRVDDVTESPKLAE
jgi:hypothetical protein